MIYGHIHSWKQNWWEMEIPLFVKRLINQKEIQMDTILLLVRGWAEPVVFFDKGEEYEWGGRKFIRLTMASNGTTKIAFRCDQLQDAYDKCKGFDDVKTSDGKATTHVKV